MITSPDRRRFSPHDGGAEHSKRVENAIKTIRSDSRSERSEVSLSEVISAIEILRGQITSKNPTLKYLWEVANIVPNNIKREVWQALIANKDTQEVCDCILFLLIKTIYNSGNEVLVKLSKQDQEDVIQEILINTFPLINNRKDNIQLVRAVSQLANRTIERATQPKKKKRWWEKIGPKNRGKEVLGVSERSKDLQETSGKKLTDYIRSLDFLSADTQEFLINVYVNNVPFVEAGADLGWTVDESRRARQRYENLIIKYLRRYKVEIRT